MAFIVNTEFEDGKEVLESESKEEHEDDLIESYKELRQTLIKIG